MKDSGIPWIGEIPKGWKVSRLKHLATDKDSLIIDGDWIENNVIEASGIRYLTTGNVGDGVFKEQGQGYISQETFNALNCTMVYAGDLVFSRLNYPMGRSCIIPEKYERCVVAVDNVIFRPNKDVSRRYLMYVSMCTGFQNENALIARGATMQRMSRSQLVRVFVPIPDRDTQQKIATFLDRKCAEVDEMIALQEHIIEELKAYKQSVITEAVTKGLNPNVPMKDSGIEWIGEIPEHWEIKKIKHLSHVVRGGSPRPAGDLRYYVGNIPFMKVADITKDDKIYVDKCEYTIKEAGLSHTRMIKSNTLLLTNSGATLGVPKINTFDTTFNDGIAAFLNLDISLDIIFAYYSLKARTQYFLDSASLGIGQPNLNTDIIGSTYLLVPPIYEQQIIVDFLNEKCADVDALISIKQRKIESLKEYKKSIIYEYVTGKKEVV